MYWRCLGFLCVGFLCGCSSWHDIAVPDGLGAQARFSRADFEDERKFYSATNGVLPNIGLAISGGGVRSASFSIGVLAGLHQEKGRSPVSGLERFDLMSTVSGGGTAAYWLYSKLHYLSVFPEAGTEIDDLFRVCHTFVGDGYLEGVLPNSIAAELDGEFTQASKAADDHLGYPCRTLLKDGVNFWKFRFQRYLKNKTIPFDISAIAADANPETNKRYLINQALLTLATAPRVRIDDFAGSLQNRNPVRINYREGIERTYGLFPLKFNQAGKMSWHRVYTSKWVEEGDLQRRADRPRGNRMSQQCIWRASHGDVDLSKFETPFANACWALNVDTDEAPEALNAEPLSYRELRQSLFSKVVKGNVRGPQGMRMPLWIMNATAHIEPLEGRNREEQFPFSSTVFEFTPFHQGSPGLGYLRRHDLEAEEATCGDPAWWSFDPLGRFGCDRTIQDYVALSAAFFDVSPYVDTGWLGVGSKKIEAMGGAWGDYVPYGSMKPGARGTKHPWPYVYVSDGGHSDNTGAYSLFRRRSKTIVVIDAGQDGQGALEDLIRLREQLQTNEEYEIELCEYGVGDLIPETGCGDGKRLRLVDPPPAVPGVRRETTCNYVMNPRYRHGDDCEETTGSLTFRPNSTIPHPILIGWIHPRDRTGGPSMRLVVVKPRLLDAYLSFPTKLAPFRSALHERAWNIQNEPKYLIDGSCATSVGPEAAPFICYRNLMTAHLVERCGAGGSDGALRREDRKIRFLHAKWSGLVCGIRIEDGFPHVSTLDFDYEADRYIAFHEIGRYYGRILALVLDCLERRADRKNSAACRKAGIASK